MALVTKNFSDIITFSRNSNAMLFDSTGTLVWAPNNHVRNNTMQGAVAGTPGTLPQVSGGPSWFVFTALTGLTTKIIGTSADSGITYIDIQISGTPSAAGVYSIGFETNTGIAASNGQTWSESVYLKLQAGSFTGVSGIRLQNDERSASAYIRTNASSPFTVSSAALNTQRFSFTSTLSGGATVAFIVPYILLNFDGAAIDITLRIGLPQVEIGPTANAVIPTRGTAYYGPRFDYNPITLAAQGLLIEEQRTNLLAWSASFRTHTLAVTAVSGAFTNGETVTATGGGTGIYYAAESTGSSFVIYQGSGAFTGTLTGATSGQTATISSAIGTWSPATQTLSLAPNIAVAPTDTSVGANWTENTAATTTRSLSQSVTITAGQTVTTSLFVKQKPGAARHFRIQTVSAGANGFNAYFNLTTGTVAVQTAALGTGTAVTNSATITPVGNGWYRISASGTVDPAATVVSTIGFMQDTPSGSAAYTGDGTSGLYIWGAQLEAGAFPTSYIPTTTTSLTRNADQASVNTLSPWFNATAGTLYAEAQHYAPSAAVQQWQAQLASGTGDYYGIYKESSPDNITTRVRSGGANQAFAYTTGALSANTTYKTALGYAVNDVASCTNGGTVFVDTPPAALPLSITALGLGQPTYTTSVMLNGYLRRITYYPRRLSNAELQAITA